MFTIGEFSRITGLTIKTLRFYHERGLLTPAFIDPGSGYRHYDPRNLDTARVIKALRDLEFPLEDIATILAECGDDEDLIEHLARQRRDLAAKLTHYQNLTRQIDQLITQQREIREATAMHQQDHNVTERDVEPILIAGIRIKGRYSDCGKVFGQLAKKVGRHIGGKAMCLYYDGEYKEDDADIEPCFPIRKEVEAEGVSLRPLPPVRCVTLVHQGPYDTLGRSYATIMEYAKSKGYQLELPTREVYLKGPGMIFKGNPRKYLTEIQLPIKS